jgi:hypothetical protein
LGAAGAAQASATPVVAAVKSQDRIVKNSAAYKSLKHVTANTPAEARKLIAEFKALQSKVEHAATVVSQASASGATQKQGQKDWVTGVRDLARGIGQFDTGLQDVIDHKTATGKAELKKATRTLATANTVGDRGDKLLGIPASD